MSGLNSKKSAEKTILYGLITIAVLVMILAGVFLAIFFSGYTRGAAKSKQEATAPVEDQVFARETGADEYILPDSEIRYLNEYDITGWSVDEIRLAKNEIYARHGRIFEDEDLDQYFRSKTWYIPSIEPEDFQTDVFNEYEKKNVEYLADAQIGKNCFTSDTFTYQDSLGEVTFAFKYPVYWSKKVMFRVSLADSGMVIHCVDVLNNKRGLSLYGDNFGTVFSFEVSTEKKNVRDGEELICSEDGLYAYVKIPEEVNYLEAEPECVESYMALQKEMNGVVKTFRVVP